MKTLKTHSLTIIVATLTLFLGYAIAKPETIIKETPGPTVTVYATPIPVVQPTPQVITKEVEVPGPTQFVYQTPQVCKDAINALDFTWTATLDILSAVLNEKATTTAEDKAFEKAANETTKTLELRDACLTYTSGI